MLIVQFFLPVEAVVQGLAEYEESQETREFMKAIAQGLIEIKEGNELELDDVKNKLDIR